MNHLNEEEIEYLTLIRNRFKFLARIIFNEPFMDYAPDKRFAVIKELYSVYSEFYSMKNFEEILANRTDELVRLTTFQKDLIKMIRNALQHFPFFNNWNDFYIQKSLVVLNISTNKKGRPNSAIHSFFTNPKNIGLYARITEVNGEVTIIAINVPSGYLENEKIFLKDIIEEQYVGKLSVGYMMILFNNFLKSRKLFNLVIPTVENE